MRWQMGRRSDNIEDQRGSGVSTPVVGGGVGVLLIALIAMFLGVDPSFILEQGSAPSNSGPRPANEEQLKDFVSVVLADTEDTWNPIFQQLGRTYQEPKLVLFSGQVNSACGLAQAAVGPFYCPADQKVYIDLNFYQELKTRHNAPGDFAQAYVIAHEIGHHAQTLLGISEQVQAARSRSGEAQANQLSVRQELQADCFAGIWANNAQRTRQILEEGDIEEALNAATQIGDDTLQRQAQGYVVPDSFTHGSAAQRVRWFKVGFQSGSLEQCDTFKVANP
jgi:predicted metalloprotease